MKIIIKISGLLLFILFINLFNFCKKEKLKTVPVISTIAVTDITYSSATCGGRITDVGGTPILSRGVCWNTTSAPSILESKTVENGASGTFSSNITQLAIQTHYYVRAYATNSVGTGYGDQLEFTTSPVEVPSVISYSMSTVSQSYAIVGGEVVADNGGSVTARGVLWSSNQDPTISENKTSDGTGTGTFKSQVSGLAPYAIYYYRAYAKNSAGTGYGDIISFQTLENPINFNPIATYGAVSDNDGNVYKTIIIGTQTWMAENLRTTKFNDNTLIPEVTDGTAWAGLTTAGFCWYKNDPGFKATYGAVYNWYALNTNALCPAGWHVPIESDWDILITYNGGASGASFKLKESSSHYWSSPNLSSNSSGFTAVAAPMRDYAGVFGPNDLVHGYWWSVTECNLSQGTFFSMSSGIVNSCNSMNWGYSVRCIKN
jgi:uncharacterized protein (TIGR02145 family)